MIRAVDQFRLAIVILQHGSCLDIVALIQGMLVIIVIRFQPEATHFRGGTIGIVIYIELSVLKIGIAAFPLGDGGAVHKHLFRQLLLRQPLVDPQPPQRLAEQRIHPNRLPSPFLSILYRQKRPRASEERRKWWRFVTYP